MQETPPQIEPLFLDVENATWLIEELCEQSMESRYLSKKEYNDSSPEIRLYEPKIAFFGGKEGFDFYYKISKILPKILLNRTLLLPPLNPTFRTQKAITIGNGARPSPIR